MEARARLASGDAATALADYQKLASLVPTSAAYQDQIGFIFAATNRTSDAIPYFERATNLNPKLAQAWFHLGVARLILKQRAGIADLEKAIALDPGDADYRLRLGLADGEAGRYADAIVQLRAASTKYATNAQLWASLGQALQQQGRFKEARDAYREAVNLEPASTSDRNGYAAMLIKCGDFTGGLAQFKKILERDPNNVHVQVNVGYAYIGAGDYKEAIRYLSNVAANHPDAADAHYDLGIAYKQTDDLQHARTELEKTVKLAPSLVEAHYVLAMTCVDLSETNEAISELKTAVARRPAYSDAWFELGMILKDQGDTNGAIEALQHSVALDPTDAGAFNTLGLLLKRKGDVEGSKVAFAKAAELRQSDANAKRRHLEQGAARLSQ